MYQLFKPKTSSVQVKNSENVIGETTSEGNEDVLEIISKVTLPSIQEVATELEITSTDPWMDYLDGLHDLKSIQKKSLTLTTAMLENSLSDESEATLQQLEELAKLLVESLSKKHLMRMKHYLICLETEDEIPCSSGSSNMDNISTSYMTARTPMDAADVSINANSNDDLEELYQRKVYQKRILNYSSNITLKLGEKSTVYSLETTNTPDYLLDLKIYDLNKVAPENIGTKDMWRDAIVRMKFYGTQLLDQKHMQAAKNLATQCIRTIQEQENKTIKNQRLQKGSAGKITGKIRKIHNEHR